ncbi:uncharacterized protein ACOB8E_014318 isoform 1-T1 [Sarcophilus harrisii]
MPRRFPRGSSPGLSSSARRGSGRAFAEIGRLWVRPAGSPPPPNLLGWRQRGPARCGARRRHLRRSLFLLGFQNRPRSEPRPQGGGLGETGTEVPIRLLGAGASSPRTAGSSLGAAPFSDPGPLGARATRRSSRASPHATAPRAPGASAGASCGLAPEQLSALARPPSAAQQRPRAAAEPPRSRAPRSRSAPYAAPAPAGEAKRRTAPPAASRPRRRPRSPRKANRWWTPLRYPDLTSAE